MDTVGPLPTALLTVLALIAFAGNSILCRLALGRGLIDPLTFSSLRISSGAFTLLLVVALVQRPTWARPRGRWPSALALALYAIPFSIAYTTLPAGIGALVLFAAVQISMLALAWSAGERMSKMQGCGFLLAAAGLIYLSWPAGTSAPDPTGVGLMLVAGVGWGVYSALGRGSDHPLQNTAGNFLLAVPFAAVASILAISSFQLSPAGASLALLSGSITSGLGYAIWYAALRGLTTTTAAAVQLSVPVLAALGGVLLLAEPLTLRLVTSAGVILGGIALSLRRVAPEH